MINNTHGISIQILPSPLEQSVSGNSEQQITKIVTQASQQAEKCLTAAVKNHDKELVMSLDGGGHLSRRLLIVCPLVADRLCDATNKIKFEELEHNEKLRTTVSHLLVACHVSYIKGLCIKNKPAKMSAAWDILRFHCGGLTHNVKLMVGAYEALRSLVIASERQYFRADYSMPEPDEDEHSNITVTLRVVPPSGEVMVGSCVLGVEEVAELLNKHGSLLWNIPSLLNLPSRVLKTLKDHCPRLRTWSTPSNESMPIYHPRFMALTDSVPSYLNNNEPVLLATSQSNGFWTGINIVNIIA